MTETTKHSLEDVSNELKNLAVRMRDVADMLRPYSPKNCEEMIGAAAMVLDWSYDVLEEMP
jgi:hypothetical protein